MRDFSIAIQPFLQPASQLTLEFLKDPKDYLSSSRKIHSLNVQFSHILGKFPKGELSTNIAENRTVFHHFSTF